MAFKTSLQQLASDPSSVQRFAGEEWESLSHYERVELIRQAAALPAPDNIRLLGELFERLDSPVFQAQILSSVDFAAAGEQAWAFLRKALANPNARVRANAVEALDALGTGDFRDMIRPLLDDEDNRVRANACVHLWRHESERSSVRETIERMSRSSDPWTRASAVYGAAKILDPSFDSLLVAALDDGYEPAIVSALRALEARSHPAAPARAAAFLSDALRGTNLWHAAADVLVACKTVSTEAEDGALAALSGTGDRELQHKLLSVLAVQEGPGVAGKILDFLERLDAGEFHLCHKLLEFVGRTGAPEHQARLEALAKGKLAMYSDILQHAAREIGRRNRRWWPR